ncbi:hypothetical protein OHB41_15675 [Streptomyces sp. NBC_01571]|uniref:hypothetical protein n=1 Tax=Streptomyces sp. NBC_01571 TaxID=2975883 RepID=UPI002252C3EF|nr:hypothetical protein [Streptomyces sp. NBC_01571]MCX4574604.1 hypothetical protein [Streptomyces sp. NBC_01571]
MRDWLSELERAVPASSYRRVIYASVSAVFTAAVDDDHLHRNPCKASTVRAPAPNQRRVTPWTADRTFAVRATGRTAHRRPRGSEDGRGAGGR